MARIAGVDLPRDKKVEIGLTYIYGIGRKNAAEIIKKSGVDAALRVRDLTDADVNKIRAARLPARRRSPSNSRDSSSSSRDHVEREFISYGDWEEGKAGGGGRGD